MSFLVLDKLTKRFGEHLAVDALSLDVNRGEFVSLLGPSGCGKTTTLQMIAGFVEPTSGAIPLEGRDLVAVQPASAGSASCSRATRCFPHMTVAENVAFGLEMQGVAAGRARRARAESAGDWSGSPALRSAIRAACRAASSSAWRSPARW